MIFVSHSQESDFVRSILKVDPNQCLNFRLFAVVAALSVRVVGLEPIVKNIIDEVW